jgi:hypothetical protein
MSEASGMGVRETRMLEGAPSPLPDGRGWCPAPDEVRSFIPQVAQERVRAEMPAATRGWKRDCG